MNLKFLSNIFSMIPYADLVGFFKKKFNNAIYATNSHEKLEAVATKLRDII